MYTIKSHKLFLTLIFILAFALTLPTISQAIDKDYSGCCEITANELCYTYDNDVTKILSYKKDDCTNGNAAKGTVMENKICVDLYYNQTSSDITTKGDLPMAGVKCIDKPTDLSDLKTKSSGLLSKECLNSGGSVKSCLVSAFFSDVGLPGSNQASDSPDAVKGILLTKVGLIINAVLGLLGIIFLLMIIYAGIQWLIAGDEEKKVTESKELIRNAITGLAITMFAYGLSYFVFNALTKISS